MPLSDNLLLRRATRADRFYAARGWNREPVSATEIAYTLARPALRAEVVSLAP
jgi:hypothetical protein